MATQDWSRRTAAEQREQIAKWAAKASSSIMGKSDQSNQNPITSGPVTTSKPAVDLSGQLMNDIINYYAAITGSRSPLYGGLQNGLLGKSNAPSHGGSGGRIYQSRRSLASLLGEEAEAPAPVKHGGFVAGEIIAHRCWYVEDGFLTSFSAKEVWAPNEPMTTKLAGQGVASIEKQGKGDIGVHVFKLERQALQFARENVRRKSYHDLYTDRIVQEAGPPTVYGRVAIWGDVVEHELGYRAEFARVIGIDGVYCGRVDMAKLCRRYKVAEPVIARGGEVLLRSPDGRRQLGLIALNVDGYDARDMKYDFGRGKAVLRVALREAVRTFDSLDVQSAAQMYIVTVRYDPDTEQYRCASKADELAFIDWMRSEAEKS